jgi:hypothetical protein
MKAFRISATLLLITFLISTPILASAQRFIRPATYSAGNPTMGVATGDFNGDGNADLAFVSNTNPAVVTLRLGIGNGRFNKGQQITLTDTAGGVLAGDWNNDGVRDLAVSQQTSQTISILLGVGDGTFSVAGSFNAGGRPGLLATGDLNGDGVPDLVSALGGSNLSVLLGLGQGQFGAAKVLGTGIFPCTYSVAVADFNGDGKADIGVVGTDAFDSPSRLVRFLGNGNGTFQKPSTYDEDFNSFSNLIAADFNHDGIPDLADTADHVSVHIGKGDGNFEEAQLYLGSTMYIVSADDIRQALAAADLNNDGTLDLMSLDYFSNTVDVLLGNGDGTFKDTSFFGTGPCPGAIAIADFDNDGKLDAAVADFCDSNFVELAGDTGKFSSRRSFYLERLAQAGSLASGYLDSDNNLDLVAADSNLKQIYVLPGNKNGAFRVGPTYAVSGQPEWVTVADLNADGKSDVITADPSSNVVSVFLGNGNGTLQAETTYATGHDPVFVAAADVNGDGKPDLLTANQTANSFSVLLAGGSGYLSHVDYTVTSPVQLGLGDFNGDGKLDIVTVSPHGSAQISLGNGDGTFSPGATLSQSGAPVSVAVADINKDGKLDLVIATSGNSSITAYLGKGDGTFQPGLASAAPANATQVLVGDFDNDGKLDAVVVAGSSSYNVTAAFLPGKGDGTFRQAQMYTIDYYGSNSGLPVSATLGDFNRDGALDLATANGTAATVSVLLNVGTN